MKVVYQKYLVELSLEQARDLLRYHAFADDDVNHPKMESGFLGSLRPYPGYLNEDNFHEIMACLQVLAGEFMQEAAMDKALVSQLWAICHLGRMWGVHPQGMLRSTGLICDADAARLEEWLDRIAEVVFYLLDGSDVETAFFEYHRHYA